MKVLIIGGSGFIGSHLLEQLLNHKYHIKCLVRDNSDTSEYLLQPGNILSEKADSVMIFLIGNAGGVLFNVNGTDVGKLGSTSEIVTNLKITNEGIVSKKLKVMPKEVKVDSLLNN